jgi:hypothetical protein
MNIIHSPSKEGQMSFFKEQAAKFARRAHSDKGGAGKGSKPRTNINSKDWQDNAENLFSFKPFWAKRDDKETTTNAN